MRKKYLFSDSLKKIDYLYERYFQKSSRLKQKLSHRIIGLLVTDLFLS